VRKEDHYEQTNRKKSLGFYHPSHSYLLWPLLVEAQEYPTKSVTLVNPMGLEGLTT